MMRTEEYNRVLNELSSIILSIIWSPESPSGEHIPATLRRLPEMTPGGFAALLMGVSLSLILCGSVTFFIGFMLMPWVIGFVMVFSVFEVLSSLSMIGRTVLSCNATSSTSTSTGKEGSGW